MKTSGKAIASLILSIAIPIIGSIFAIIFGHNTRSEIKDSNGRLTCSGLALAGLIIKSHKKYRVKNSNKRAY